MSLDEYSELSEAKEDWYKIVDDDVEDFFAGIVENKGGATEKAVAVKSVEQIVVITPHKRAAATRPRWLINDDNDGLVIMVLLFLVSCFRLEYI